MLLGEDDDRRTGAPVGGGEASGGAGHDSSEEGRRSGSAGAAKTEDAGPSATGEVLGGCRITPYELERFKASIDIPYEPPRRDWSELVEAPQYYDWRETFPFLQHMLKHFDVIKEEMLGASNFVDWPEHNLYKRELGADWKVLPFVHTFPATDESKRQWVESGTSMCPRITAILKAIPGIRTALLSRMGPKTTLAWHQGWADLSNHVLRCHLPLVVPEPGTCGMSVEGVEQLHEEGDFLIFDDSKMHRAFNNHETATRSILIFDILRPATLPRGEAEGATTEALEGFKAYFK